MYILSKCYSKWTPNTNAAWVTWLKIFGVELDYSFSELWTFGAVRRHRFNHRFNIWYINPPSVGSNLHQTKEAYRQHPRRIQISYPSVCVLILGTPPPSYIIMSLIDSFYPYTAYKPLLILTSFIVFVFRCLMMIIDREALRFFFIFQFEKVFGRIRDVGVAEICFWGYKNILFQFDSTSVLEVRNGIMKFQILEYDMQSQENSELTGDQHVRGFSKLKSSIELANETQANSGKEHKSSVVRTITGSLPHAEQCVELHMNGAENSRKWRCRNLLKELKVLFHLSWPICLSSFLEQTLFQLVVSIFCCHSSTYIYAAFVAAASLVNIFGTAFIIGISTAADKLCPFLWRRTLQGNGVHPSKSYTNLHSL